MTRSGWRRLDERAPDTGLRDLEVSIRQRFRVRVVPSASSSSPTRTSILRPLLGTAGLGFVYGALYGVAIAVLHVLHNSLESSRESVILGAELALLYGGAAAALCAVGAVLVLGLQRWRSRGDSVDHNDERFPVDRPGRRLAGLPLWLGLFLFGLSFWLPFFLWGLTYDQTWGVELRDGTAMAIYLLGAALLVAVAVAGLSALADRAVRLLEDEHRLGLGLAVAAVLAVVALVISPFLANPAPAAPPPSAAAEGSDPETGTDAPETAETATKDATDGTPPPVAADAGGSKVVLVGLDGLDPRVLDRLVAAGAMPTLERLRHEGVYGPLETLPNANSAVLWASIYTGFPPGQHGVHDFYRVHIPGVAHGLYPVHRTFFKEAAELFGRAGLARRVTITRGDLAVPPVWEIADWAGLSIGVADGYLYSFPALAPRTEGGWFFANGIEVFAEGLASGQSSGDDLDLYVQPSSVLSDTELPHGADFEWQARATLDLLRARTQPRLLVFYTHEPDTVQHQHWRTFEPWRYLGAGESTTGADAEDASGPVADLHRRFDAFLGELLEAVEPGTTLVVLSDHGHSPTIVHSMDTQHRHGPPGVYLLHGGPIREGYRYTPRAAQIYDVMPTVLYLLGLPVSRDLPGRVLEEALDPELMTERPVRTIESYRRLMPAPATGAARDARANEAELEKLRKLGYVW